MTDSHGCMDWAKSVIMINAKLCYEDKMTVLLHEILHCIGYVTHFGADLIETDTEGEAEEKIIKRLDEILAQVIRDNNLRFK